MDDQPDRSRPDDEREFLAGYDASEFARCSVAVDVALVSAIDGALCALLVRRDQHPARGTWTLPGGFVGRRESLAAASARVLESKAGIGEVYLEQLYTFGDPDRDPRTRVVTVAYYALVEAGRLLRAEGGQEGVILARIEVPWQGEAGGPVVVRDRDGAALAVGFDHADILGLVVKRMRGKLDYTAIGFELLPQRFTLRQLQEVHEAILGRRLNKDSFRRRVLALGLVDPTGERERGVEHRPAELYRFRTST